MRWKLHLVIFRNRLMLGWSSLDRLQWGYWSTPLSSVCEYPETIEKYWSQFKKGVK